MRPLARGPATVAAALLAAAVAGCGVGAGEGQEGTATLTVTRDYGAERMLEATVDDPPATETVARFLDREAEIETSYGGNFVDAIEGVGNRVEGGRSEDWFFYVNGYWSPVGAGEAEVRPGDRVWWDYRDWTDAYRVSAVVGSWPEPFLHGSEGGPPAVELHCFEVEAACAEVGDRLDGVGAEVETFEDQAAPEDRGGEALRVLVGPWKRLREDRAAVTLERGPGVSGVFGRPVRCAGGYGLELLDEQARPRALLEDAAWVAAVGEDAREATWLVSGGGEEQVERAAGMLDGEVLGDRYAVAAGPDGPPQPLPAVEEELAADAAGDEEEGGCG